MGPFGVSISLEGVSMRVIAGRRRLGPIHFRLLAGASLVIPAMAHGQAAPQPTLPQDSCQSSDQTAGQPVQTTRTKEGEIVVVARHYVPEGAETATKTNIPLIQTPQ